jgi:uncharacterized protein (TIGR00730 family)
MQIKSGSTPVNPAHPARRLAFDDPDFLALDENRGVRLQLEWLKPELALREAGIAHTVVVFGSARFVSMDTAQQQLDKAMQQGDEAQVKLAQRALQHAAFYEAARSLAHRVATEGLDQPASERLTVCTGGGPGIMEAANRGAAEAGAVSVALNIQLPHEQQPNPYVTDHLCFQFHYFALRKLHFMMRAKALVAFPGGFGTLDEVFEILTLIQTHKTQKVPVLLYGSAYWKRLIDFDWMLQEGTISQEDVQCFQYVDSVAQAWSVIQQAFDHRSEG